MSVQLDLEDPTLLEIAEILDSQAGDKYTVMLVRNAEDVDNASFVHVQMLNEDGRESVRYVCVCVFVCDVIPCLADGGRLETCLFVSVLSLYVCSCSPLQVSDSHQRMSVVSSKV